MKPQPFTYNIIMAERESFVLTRDVNTVTIPDGTPSTLSKGESVTIHQSLGNNYTVVTEQGHMVRIDGAAVSYTHLTLPTNREV